MKPISKNLRASVAALAIVLVPSLANADREFVLVNHRHVFSLGQDWTSHLAERQAVETTYADDMNIIKSNFDRLLSSGTDQDELSDAADGVIGTLDDQRDSVFAQWYPNDDQLRTELPQLNVEGDGVDPYTLVAMDTHTDGDTTYVDDFVPYAPWPNSGLVEFHGWQFGTVYTPDELVEKNRIFNFQLTVFGKHFGHQGICGSKGATTWSLNGYHHGDNRPTGGGWPGGPGRSPKPIPPTWGKPGTFQPKPPPVAKGPTHHTSGTSDVRKRH